MKSDTWKHYFESVGMAAIVVSLVFVGYELRQSTAVARSDAYTNFSSQFFELVSNAALDERMSNLLSQVNRGAHPSELTTDEQASIRMYQGAAVRVWEGLFRSVQAGILHEDALVGAANGMIINNEYFKSTWASTKQIYTNDFVTWFESLPWNN